MHLIWYYPTMTEKTCTPEEATPKEIDDIDGFFASPSGHMPGESWLLIIEPRDLDRP